MRPSYRQAGPRGAQSPGLGANGEGASLCCWREHLAVLTAGD